MNPRVRIMVEISYPSAACSSGKMSLKNRGDSITVATFDIGRRRHSVRCNRKRALLPSWEASPAVVAQPFTGAATTAVAGRRRRWDKQGRADRRPTAMTAVAPKSFPRVAPACSSSTQAGDGDSPRQ